MTVATLQQSRRDYRSLVLEMRPKAYWRLNEGAGSTAVDLAGGYDGTHQNEGDLSFGVSGAINRDPSTATRFGGSSGYIDIPTASAVTGPNNRTTCAWLIDEGDSGDALNEFISWGNFGAEGRQWSVGVNNQSNRGMVGAVRVPIFGATVTSDVSVRDGKWHHICALLDGSTLADVSIYVDGLITGFSDQTNVGTSVNSQAANAYIGQNQQGGSSFLHGPLCEVIQFDRALNADEITALYLAGRNGVA